MNGHGEAVPAMAEIHPFHGLRFDPTVTGNMGQVICPPYDVIDAGMQVALHDRSPYNIVRLEYSLAHPSDGPSHNKYTRAGETLNEWTENGVLKRDPRHGFYLHQHDFTYLGKSCMRLGLFAAVRLEEWEKGVVRRHEGTAAVFKMDRLNLLRATRTNISPVLAMYQDDRGKIASVLEKTKSGSPLWHTSTEGESHTLWSITRDDQVAVIRDVMSKQSIYIADGHHRYETGLNYRDERRAAFPTAGSNAAFNFIMMSLIELSDPCVIVLPTHRMVRGLSASVLSGLKEKLKEYFELNAVQGGSLSGDAFSGILDSRERGRMALGMVGPEKDTPFILIPRERQSLRELMPAGRSEAYSRLDVSVLHHVVLEHLLGLEEGQNISYTRSELEACQRVASGEYQVAFLLGPVDTHAIKAVADAGDKMPQKSTYFYPKAPTGIVLNQLDGEI